jgi:uncharacterized protein with FMN-binding domain
MNQRYFALTIVSCLLLLSPTAPLLAKVSVKKLPVQDVDLTTIPDGSYTGSFTHDDIHYEVESTIKDHTIVAIEILNNKKSRWARKAERIIPVILERQTANVDGISGASISSMLLKKAVEDSLLNGQQKP